MKFTYQYGNILAPTSLTLTMFPFIPYLTYWCSKLIVAEAIFWTIELRCQRSSCSCGYANSLVQKRYPSPMPYRRSGGRSQSKINYLLLGKHSSPPIHSEHSNSSREPQITHYLLSASNVFSKKGRSGLPHKVCVCLLQWIVVLRGSQSPVHGACH